MTTPSDYPPPLPTRTRKAELFHIDDYAERDKYACAVRVIVSFDLLTCSHDNSVRSTGCTPQSATQKCSFIDH